MDQIGDYLVKRLVGEGGMGKVYEGEERLSKRRVALKVLHPELAKSEQGRRLFTNEMQILAHLEHKNIVRSLASIEVDGQLVMVLEYLNGKTLRTVLNERGRLGTAEAVAVVMRVASALSAAHGQTPPIIHRDLKPENIMVVDGGEVKVMDFGIAKVIEALNQTNTQSVGTLQYMSPEQIDAHTIDHRSDLYCLGLVFYEMLAGRPPFHSASPRQLLNMQCTQEPPALPDDVRASLPKGVEQLLFQLLEKAPEDRPYFADDVAERLAPFESAGPPSVGVVDAASGVVSPREPSIERRTPERAVSRGDSAPTPPRAGGDDRAESGARDRSSSPGNGQAAAADGPGRGGQPRADTIALVERVETAREIPTRIALLVILALSLLAGAGAYLAKATSGGDEAPAATATALSDKPPTRKRADKP